MLIERIHDNLASVLKNASPRDANWSNVQKLEDGNDREIYEITSKGAIGRLAGIRVRVVPGLGLVTLWVQEMGTNGGDGYKW